MTDIAGNLNDLKLHIPSGVQIVAVSKTKPAGDVLEAYNCGQRIFGENRIQELLSKKVMLPDDIEWHLIGHLQSNKVKLIVPFISLIQSIDTLKLLQVVDNEAFKINRVIDCLLQVHIATEETKFGFGTGEVIDLLNTTEFSNLRNVRICGLMGMATFSDSEALVRSEFRNLAKLFSELKEKYFAGKTHFKVLSMGMSGDYKIAVSEGSTMIRVGSSVFGDRQK